MFKTLGLLIILLISLNLVGCSYVIHKKEPKNKHSRDQGTETLFELKGPRAAITHSF